MMFKPAVELVKINECAFCGRRISQDETEWIGCCPVCRPCYRRIYGKR